MAFFSPQSLAGLTGAARGGSGQVQAPQNQSPSPSGALPTLALGLAGVFSQYAERRAREESYYRDVTYASATSVAQNRFDLDLKRELRKFYGSDGKDVDPTGDYAHDLGFGVTLVSKDFREPGTNRRRLYSEVVEALQERFSEVRRKRAPSVRAESLTGVRLEQGMLRSRIDARSTQDSRQGMVYANNLNTIVRAYRDAIGESRGFSEDQFATHMESMMETSQAATSSLDPGAVRDAFRAALSDMVKVGVSEAAADSDNVMALRILARSPLANSEAFRRAAAGISLRDRAYLDKMRKGFKKAKGGLRAEKGALPPDDKTQWLEWAVDQMDAENVGEVETRALQAFGMQTTQARAALDARIQGLMASAWSPALRDAGFRQTMRQSASKAMRDVARFWPRDLYPAEHADKTARVLVGAASSGFRDAFQNVPTPALAAAAGSLGSAVAASIRASLPQDGYVSTIPLQKHAADAAASFGVQVSEQRAKDPYGYLVNNDKGIREVERRLTRGAYAPGEKYRDQRILRSMVQRRSSELGMPLTFISGTDMAALKTLATLGRKGPAATMLAQIREKYGDLTYLDQIVPWLSADKDIGPLLDSAAFVPSPAVGEALTKADINAVENRRLLKEMGIEGDRIGEELTGTFSWIFDPFDRYAHGSHHMERIDNHIEDVVGPGAAAAQAKANMRRSILNLATQNLITGNYKGGFFTNEVEEAVRSAVATVSNGIGRAVEVDGRKTLAVAANVMNEPRQEALRDVLRNRVFLDDRVYPYVVPNPATVEKAQMEGVEPFDLLSRWFEDEDLLSWRQAYEGLVPVVENPIFPDLTSAVPAKRGGAFLIPWEDVPAIIADPRYK